MMAVAHLCLLAFFNETKKTKKIIIILIILFAILINLLSKMVKHCIFVFIAAGQCMQYFIWYVFLPETSAMTVTHNKRHP